MSNQFGLSTKEPAVHEWSSTTSTLSADDVMANELPTSSLRVAMHHRLLTHGKENALWALYVIIHVVVFALSMAYHLTYFTEHENLLTIRITSALSKASGLMLHLDVAVVLFPMCHNVVNFLRHSLPARLSDLDGRISTHKFVAWSMVLFTWIHVVAQWAMLARRAAQQEKGFRGFLINNFATGVGWTGQVALLLLMLISATSIDSIRKFSFLNYPAVHQLAIPFFILWGAHESFVYQKVGSTSWTANGTMWQYWLCGAVVYLIEVILKETRGSKKSFVTKVIQHPSHVFEVQIKKQGVLSGVGQVSWRTALHRRSMLIAKYIKICFPETSVAQYHPFTLTSAPEEDYLSIHICCMDEITRAIGSSLGCRFPKSGADNDSSAVVSLDFESLGRDAPPTLRKLLPCVFIDGPFGSAFDNIFGFETVVLVGAGKGVTPFASILKSIWYHVNYPRQTTQLSKAYFFWICRDFDTFEWFQSLLLALEAQDLDNHIEIHTVS